MAGRQGDLKKRAVANLSKFMPEIVAGSRAVLGLGPVTGNEVLAMLDWLLKR